MLAVHPHFHILNHAPILTKYEAYTLWMGPTDYHYPLRNIAEESSSQLL